jgi:hypothetical protein
METIRDPQGLQAPRRGGLSYRRGVATCGEREVDPAWASEYAALVVGAAAVGVESSRPSGVALAGSVRSHVSAVVQGARAKAPAAGCRLQPGQHGRRPAQSAPQIHRRFRELGSRVEPHLSGRQSGACEGGAWGRATVGGGPVRRRRLDPLGGVAARL